MGANYPPRYRGPLYALPTTRLAVPLGDLKKYNITLERARIHTLSGYRGFFYEYIHARTCTRTRTFNRVLGIFILF